MPQLDFSTYPSQIFWALLGFAFVYLFVSKYVAPTMIGIMQSRSHYIDSILCDADRLNQDAQKLKEESAVALENAQIDISSKESKLIADFREKSIAEKEAFFANFAKQSVEQSKNLTSSAAEAFQTIANSSDAIIDEIFELWAKEKDNAN